MFDMISSTYDFVNRVLSLGQDMRWRKRVAREVPLRPHLEILDIASGTGDQLLALFKAGLSIHKAIGIDVAEEMLKIGREKLKRFPEASLMTADAQKLPFGAASFDVTTCSFGIRNIPDVPLALREMFRVLKPRGKCLILEFSMPNRLVQPFFLFYLRKIVPRLGGFLSKNKAAYRYLNRSIEAFPSGEAFLAKLREVGFSAKRISMNLGGVSLYVGEKP